jgi:hypothetical protein
MLKTLRSVSAESNGLGTKSRWLPKQPVSFATRLFVDPQVRFLRCVDESAPFVQIGQVDVPLIAVLVPVAR